MMADNGNNNVFVYMGGDQRVPQNVTHVRVHKSVKIISQYAFSCCDFLVSIEMHDGVEIIEEMAFCDCPTLRGIKIPGVRVIENQAFEHCTALEEVEFGDKLETVGSDAFGGTSLRNIKMPKVRFIGRSAFSQCKQLTDVELSEYLETIQGSAFADCLQLRRIAMPLKRVSFEDDGYDGDGLPVDVFPAFEGCHNLSRVDFIGEIHNAVSLLLLERWRDEMNLEIDRINQVLPNTDAHKKDEEIEEWLERTSTKIEVYKSKHYELLKDYVTLLELALWKVKLHENEGEDFSLRSDLSALLEEKMTLLQLARWKAKFDERFTAARQAERINCGANIIIPLVLPFLNDDDVFPLVHYDPANL
jgi:hypothetical protein